MCYTWNSNNVYSWSTLSRRRSSLSSPHVGAEEDGCAEVSGTEVNLSISSSISPSSSSTWSYGIICTPILEPLMWAVLLVNVCTPMGLSLWTTVRPLRSLSLVFAIRPIISEGKRHNYSGILLLNASLQNVEDVSTNINLFVSEEIVQKDCPWSGQCSEVGDRV